MPLIRLLSPQGTFPWFYLSKPQPLVVTQVKLEVQGRFESADNILFLTWVVVIRVCAMYKHLFLKPQMMQLLWKTVCHFLKNFNMELPL